MKLIRLPNWSSKLREYIAATRTNPYSVPSNDCAHWVAGAIEVMTGTNPMPDVTYEDAEQQGAYLQAHGGLLTIINEILGDPHGPNNARRGDVVYFEIDGGGAVGICTGMQFFLPGDKGLVDFNMAHALYSWRIG